MQSNICGAGGLCDSLLCAGVVNLAVAEDSAGHVVAHRSSADVDEPVGLH